MNLEEYQEEVARLDHEYKEAKGRLKREYALTNNPVRIGTIAEDDCGNKVMVKRISIAYTHWGEVPSECVYHGELLKKDGTPRKDGKADCVYQSRLKK